MKRGVIFVALLVLLPLFSATIVLEDSFEEIYNIGDKINVSFSVENNLDVNDFLEVYSDCGDNKFVVAKNYYEIEANDKKEFSYEFPVSNVGECSMNVEFGDDLEKSVGFELSDRIEIDFDLNDKSYMPGEEVKINGTAIKSNGKGFSGGVLVTVTDIIEKTLEIENGRFSSGFFIPNNADPKTYVVGISAVEKNGFGVEINRGAKASSIEVKSKPTTLIIEAGESVKPPMNLTFNIKLVDQIGKSVANQTMIVNFFDFDNNLVFEKQVSSNEEFVYFFESDAIKGGWMVNAFYGNLSLSTPIYVEENRQLGFELDGDQVQIKNIGNVRYEGVASFVVSNSTYNETILENVDLEVGEVYEPLLDYGGYFDLNIGNTTYEGVYLTGAAIIFDLDSPFTLRSYIISFFILFLIVVLFFTRKKKLIRKSVARIGGLFKRKKKEKPTAKASSWYVSGLEEKEETSSKKAHILFMKSDKGFNHIADLLTKYGFSMNEVNPTLGYILSHKGSSKEVADKMFDFSKEVMQLTSISKIGMSLVLNSEEFENRAVHLKRFALVSRKLIEFAEGKTLVSKDFLNEVGVHPPMRMKTLNVSGKQIVVYLL